MKRLVVRPGAPLALLVALALPACSRGDGTSPALSSGENAETAVFLAQAKPAAGVMDAEYAGKVNRDAQGCLRVESEGGAVVIWPYGFRLAERDGGLFVEDAGGRTIGRIGGHFRTGGGFVPASHADALLSAADRARAAACPTTYYWIVGDTR